MPAERTLTMRGFLQLRAGASTGANRRFYIEAYNGGALLVDGFEMLVYVDLETLIQPPDGIPICLDHQLVTEKTLGHTDTINNTGQSLSLAGDVTGEQWPAVKNVLDQFDRGHRWQASIGCVIYEVIALGPGQTAAINGQMAVGPCFLAYNARLRETSVLPNGADNSTTVNLAASAAISKGAFMPTFEEWLATQADDPKSLTPEQLATYQTQYDALKKDGTGGGTTTVNASDGAGGSSSSVLDFTTWLLALGFALKDLSDQQRAALSVKYQAETGQAATMPGTDGASTDGGTPLQASMAMRRQADAREYTRQEAIKKAGAGYPKIIEAGIRQGWSPEITELHVRREKEKEVIQAPAAHVGRPRSNAPLVIEAALYMASDLKKAEKHYKPEILELANDGYRGYGIQRLLLEAAAANGYHVAPGETIQRHNFGQVMKHASGEEGRLLNAAGPSHANVPGILSNVANKSMEDGYLEEDQSWREIANIKSPKDFKPLKIYRMLDNMEFKPLTKGGEITYGTLSEESYTAQARTYARMAELAREDIINDDLGVFDTLRKRIGQGAAQSFNRVFWSTFIGLNFFTVENKNYIEGADTDLDPADPKGLEALITQFSKIRSPKKDGSKVIAGLPKVLLVPPELQHAAERYYVLSNLGAGTTVGAANIHANKYKPVVCPFLSDTTTHASASSTAWWLFRDPGVLAPMVVTFLGGAQMPTVETEESVFNRLGIQFRGYHDYGADAAEPLAGAKSKGAA